jgi:hypothetical protein
MQISLGRWFNSGSRDFFDKCFYLSFKKSCSYENLKPRRPRLAPRAPPHALPRAPPRATPRVPPRACLVPILAPRFVPRLAPHLVPRLGSLPCAPP